MLSVPHCASKTPQCSAALHSYYRDSANLETLWACYTQSAKLLKYIIIVYIAIYVIHIHVILSNALRPDGAPSPSKTKKSFGFCFKGSLIHFSLRPVSATVDFSKLWMRPEALLVESLKHTRYLFEIIFMIWTEMFYLYTEITEKDYKKWRNSERVTSWALPLPPRWAQLDLSCTLQVVTSCQGYSRDRRWSESTRT